jgi:hypothetical protein
LRPQVIMDRASFRAKATASPPARNKNYKTNPILGPKKSTKNDRNPILAVAAGGAAVELSVMGYFGILLKMAITHWFDNATWGLAPSLSDRTFRDGTAR